MNPTSALTPDGRVWSGRNDGSGPPHRRWHHIVRSADPTAGEPGGVALVGFACDEGVRRNQGRTGAAQAPDALRRALASLAVHVDLEVADAGTVTVDDGDLEGGHERLAGLVAPLVDRHELVIALGGGHETAWGTYIGRTRSARLGDLRVGVLNLDAHFDLRDETAPTSGTPFLQMARADRAAGRDFDYTVLGISEPSNTAALFDAADDLGVRYRLDEACAPQHLPEVLATVDGVLERVDALHLSIDLDVLPAAVAPGVSAPAGFGVALEVVHAVCRHVARSGKLALVDVVELAPRFDLDGRTACTAARLITTMAHAATSARAHNEGNPE